MFRRVEYIMFTSLSWRCSWGVHVGLEPGATVKAVGANSQWIAVELERHRLKYLPLWHPVHGSALFQRINEDGSPHPYAHPPIHPPSFDLDVHLEAVRAHLRRARDLGSTRLSVLCKVLEKQLQRPLRGFEKQEARHFANKAKDVRENEHVQSHRRSNSAPNLMGATTSSWQSPIGGPQEDQILPHNAKARENVTDSDDGDSSDGDGGGDDDGDAGGDGDDDADGGGDDDSDDDDGGGGDDGGAGGDDDGGSGGSDNELSFRDVKAELWRAVAAGATVDQASLARWLEQIYSRPLNGQEGAWVAAFIRQAMTGAAVSTLSARLRGDEDKSRRRSTSGHSALISAAPTGPSPPREPLPQRPSIGDSVRVLPGHPRVCTPPTGLVATIHLIASCSASVQAGQVGQIQYDDMSPEPYIVEVTIYTSLLDPHPLGVLPYLTSAHTCVLSSRIGIKFGSRKTKLFSPQRCVACSRAI